MMGSSVAPSEKAFRPHLGGRKKSARLPTREGKVERGQEGGARAGKTKGQHLPGRKGRPLGEGGEANYS